jgi:hypothetical protein
LLQLQQQLLLLLLASSFSEEDAAQHLANNKWREQSVPDSAEWRQLALAGWIPFGVRYQSSTDDDGGLISAADKSHGCRR